MKRSTMRVLAAARHEMQDDFGVGGRLVDRAVADEFAAQRQAIGEIAVVGDGEAAGIEFGEQRLHIAQDGLAGRRIADMADGADRRAGARSSRPSRNDRRPARAGARN